MVRVIKFIVLVLIVLLSASCIHGRSKYECKTFSIYDNKVYWHEYDESKSGYEPLSVRGSVHWRWHGGSFYRYGYKTFSVKSRHTSFRGK